MINLNNNGCAVCNNYLVEWHHVFYGAGDREISTKQGFGCKLCPEHHRGGKGVHGGNIELDLALKRHFQSQYEKDHTRAEWMALIGRNYLEV